MRGLLLVLAACGRFGFGADEHDDALSIDDTGVPICTGHDEDGDAVPDACDNCPAVANADQRNDGEVDAGIARDEVGDACDPRPTVDGDYVMRFETHETMAVTSYVRTGGTATWQSDALRLGTLADSGSATFELATYPSRVSIATRVVDASTTELQWFGVWYNMRPIGGNPKIFAHGADNAAVVADAVFTIKEQDPQAVQRFCSNGGGPPAFAPGDTYVFVVDTNLATGSLHTLAVRSMTQSWTCTLSIGVVPYNAGFLEASKMVIDFDYLIAYGVR